MVYRDEVLKLAEENIRYTRKGEEFLQPVVEGREWWIEFEGKWDDMEIIGFEPIEYTEEQLTRFEEIKEMQNVSDDVLNVYVMDGIFGEGLEELEYKRKIQQLEADLDYLSIMSEVDINV